MHRKAVSVMSITAAVLSLIATAVPASARFYWAPWDSPSICTERNEAAVGFGCSGRYCSRVRLLCETMPFNLFGCDSPKLASSWFRVRFLLIPRSLLRGVFMCAGHVHALGG